MKYVDVILPLPLPGLFTYSVPDGMEGRVVFGKRLLVPLGRSKKYIGMAVKTHDEKPAFEVKPIEQVLDENPVLLERQYRLWSWISDYYMSPLGDVYNAAFPAGLKSTEKFKPKMELYVGLSSAYRNPQTLRVALQMMGRAVKQMKAFTTFLQLSHWDILLENEVDENGLLRIVHNLTSNCLKYGQKEASISLECAAGRAVLTFRNHAEGFTEKDAEQIFHRFYRKDASRNAQGSGLGMSVAKLLAEQMGGRLDARLEEGMLAIRLLLPCADKSADT